MECHGCSAVGRKPANRAVWDMEDGPLCHPCARRFAPQWRFGVLSIRGHRLSGHPREADGAFPTWIGAQA